MICHTEDVCNLYNQALLNLLQILGYQMTMLLWKYMSGKEVSLMNVFPKRETFKGIIYIFKEIAYFVVKLMFLLASCQFLQPQAFLQLVIDFKISRI